MLNNTKNITHKDSKALFLTQEEIERVLVEAIRSYKKQQMSLLALAKLAKEINQNKKYKLTYSLKKDLAEISSFSVIDTVLNDIQEELTENNPEEKRNL